MNRLIVSLLIIISLVSPVYAQQNTTRFFIAYDYANLTVDTTAGGVFFATADIAGTKAQSVTFTVACASGTDCPVRFTIDTTVVTTSVGMRVDYGQSVTIYGNGNITRFRAIREGAVSAILNTTFFQ